MSTPADDIIYSNAPPECIAGDLAPLIDFQDDSMELKELSKVIHETLIPHLAKYNRPEFHSLYNCYPEEGAELGAQIALHYNQGVTNWQVSPGGVMLEELCCKSLCSLFGMDANADATFMYCGTYANQQALYMALHWKAEQRGFNFAERGLRGFADPSRLAVLASRDAHFSLKHAVRFLGLGDGSLIPVAVDGNRRMDAGKLAAMVDEVKRTREIVCIVATAGTTSSGSIDPILPVVELCRDIRAWSHVDGAYGLAFRLLPEQEHLFDGIESARSVCWDPHKAFGTPIPSSLLFANDKDDFQRLAIYGDYFNRRDDPEPNPGFKSPPSTRPLSALPLVASIRHQGMKKVRERLRAPLKAVSATAEELGRDPEIELCHQPDTGILCLRVVPEGFPPEKLNDLQKYIYEAIKRDGRRSLSMTAFNGRWALRLVAISPCVTAEAMLETVSLAKRLAAQYQRGA